MKKSNPNMTIALASVCLTLLGCSAVDDKAGVQADLTLAVSRFESAEANFGPSSNYDELVKNGHWLDRMAEEIQAIERIETKAISLGSPPISELREELAQRFRRRLTSLQSDMKYLDVKAEFERAEMWMDIARNAYE